MIGKVATNTSNTSKRRAIRRATRLTSLGLMAAAGAVLGGCNADSFFDPSVTGYWKATPTTVPILKRLSAIEDEPTEYVTTSPVTPSDLVPEVDTYHVSPGDAVDIHIQDYITLGKEEIYTRFVDSRGFIDIPRLPQIRASGLNSSELTSAIEQAIRDRQIMAQPVVAVELKTQRKQTFSVLGAVQTPGTYLIPAPDYRLLEGMTSAGSVNEQIPFIYVVRQVRLTEAAMGRTPEPEPTNPTPGMQNPAGTPGTPSGEAPKKGEDLINLIDEITNKPGTQKKDLPKSPGAMGGGDVPAAPVRAASEPPPSAPPTIDLPDSNRAPAPTSAQSGGGWVYSDGKWVRTQATNGGGAPVSAAGGSNDNVVTQRVIKIPVGPLLAGAADVNIVLRPGDVIRAPVPRTGLVYITGQVSRPGPYSIPTDGQLTLTRAITAAGGLGNIAIPEKVELTRMVGNDKQATILLNLRAIAKGTQPDIYIKPDDQINVGTNFWAYPVAIMRSGFRASYGYGFILDRNFQGDVFGPDIAQSGGG